VCAGSLSDRTYRKRKEFQFRIRSGDTRGEKVT
jgi:hypothetical protein